MPKIPHLPIKRRPTLEIFARFAPGALEEISAIRTQYDPKPSYPRDIGIRLFRDIIKNDQVETALKQNLPNIASSIAPFQVDFIKPFRNMSAEERNYPASVFYEINNWPFNIICADLRMMLNKLRSRSYDRPLANKSFKIGITGEIDKYEDADRIVKELAEREKPKNLLFDAFVLASRPNEKPLSELEQEAIEFPFTAAEETFQIYLQDITAKRDSFVLEKKEKMEQDRKKKEIEASTIVEETEVKPEEALDNEETSKDL